MRIMALDIGEVRVGVAISDPGERVASPICVLPANEVSSCAKSFRRVLEDWEPELLLCGLPYTMAGEEKGRVPGQRCVRYSSRVHRRAFELVGGQT